MRYYHTVLVLAVILLSSHLTFAQTWRVLFDQADSLFRTGALDAAYTAHQRATAQAIREFGKENLNYVQSIIAEGKIKGQQNDYGSAEKILTESYEILKRIEPFGEDMVETLDYIGLVYVNQGRSEMAEMKFQEALSMSNKLEGTTKSKYRAFTLYLLADLHYVSRQWHKAEPLLFEALKLEESLTGKFDRQYAVSLHALSNIYLGLQQYDKAQEALLEVLVIKKQVFGSEASTFATSLGNMGGLYLQLGDYTNAISYFRQSLTIEEKNGRTSTINFATSLQNLGICYNHTKQYDKADSLQKKALILLEKKTGKKTVEYANALSNRASIYQSLKQPQEACRIYDDVLGTIKANIGTENLPYAGYLNSAASANIEAGKYAKADSLNKIALSIIERLSGKKTVRFATYLSTESELQLAQNKSEEAIVQMEEALGILEMNFIQTFLYLAPRQKETFTNRWSSLYGKYFSMITENSRPDRSTGRLYNTNIFLKNMLLNEHSQLVSVLDQSADKILTNRLDSLRKIKDLIANLYTKPIKLRQNIDSLETKAEILEKDLARQSVSFRQAQQSIRVQWEDVRNALKPNEAAVEFMSFPYHNGRQQTDSIRYMALVLRPGDKAPQLVPLLTDEAPLRRLLAKKMEVSTGAGLYAMRGSEIDNDQLTRGDSLYQLIWQPIDRLLTGVKTVYLAPSGLLHQVSFAALPYRDSRRKDVHFLADRYQLRQVGSTRQVATQAHQADTYQSLTSARLYGGIQYDTSSASATARLPTKSSSLRSSGVWPYLPGTQNEVEQIGQLIGPKATVVTGTAATETALKNLSGQSPAVLHIATHGFAFPDPTGSPNDSSAGRSGAMFRRIANPLLRTGLLMAGANRAWQGERPALGEDDGILTAYEVANLNLSTTKLVVLSACETALGDIRGSEGVFGLQRAFKMAGAGYLLMSLWPVADQATSDLMTQFYREWKKHKLIRKAFEQTQFQMRKKYPPSVWAAFVLIE